MEVAVAVVEVVPPPPADEEDEVVPPPLPQPTADDPHKRNSRATREATVSSNISPIAAAAAVAKPYSACDKEV